MQGPQQTLRGGVLRRAKEPDAAIHATGQDGAGYHVSERQTGKPDREALSQARAHSPSVQDEPAGGIEGGFIQKCPFGANGP